MGMNWRGLTMVDTLVNLVSGLGTTKDKKMHGQFLVELLDKGTVESMFRGDWIARKAIMIPADDATREWRLWKIENEDVEDLEEIEREFDIQNKVNRAMWLARLYGGSAMIMVIKNSPPESELDPETVGKDDLEYVHVVNRHQLGFGQLQTNILKPYYMEPDYYTRASNDGMVRIHPSRVIRFIGQEYPDPEQVGEPWGESILQSVYDAVRAAASVCSGVASLIEEAKFDIIQIPGLSNNLSTKQYTDRLVERFTNANMLKGLTNALVLDEKETWQQVTRSFASLPEMLQMYLMIAAAAVDVPATRFLGRSPAGLNATGESDLRNYYDHVGAIQKNDLTPRLSRLDEVLVRSAMGEYDESLYYNWAPLWQMTEMEKADLAAKKATVFKADLDSGLFPIEVMQEARKSQLIEDGLYPGLEASLEEHADDEIPRLEQEELNKAMQEKQLKQPFAEPKAPTNKPPAKPKPKAA